VTKDKKALIRDTEGIKTDYLNGMSIVDICGKYKIFNAFEVWKILDEDKLLRNISEARLFKSQGWRKLVGVGKQKATKLVSIPYSLLRRLGFEKGESLEAQWSIAEQEEATIKLKIRKRVEEGGEKDGKGRDNNKK